MLETEPHINSTYIQTGKASLVFRNFVTHGPDSITAAVAAQCAKDQGKFWNFYATLYNNQGEENSGWASKDNMKKFASQIPGLDTQKFNSCLDSGKYNSLVNKGKRITFNTKETILEINHHLPWMFYIHMSNAFFII